MKNPNRSLLAIALVLATLMGVTTYVTNSAARDATGAAERAEQNIDEKSSELADFITCALVILPEDRTPESLDACTEQAGIELPP